MRISLDLDDGVKVNYAKFGNLVAESKVICGTKDEDWPLLTRMALIIKMDRPPWKAKVAVVSVWSVLFVVKNKRTESRSLVETFEKENVA